MVFTRAVLAFFAANGCHALIMVKSDPEKLNLDTAAESEAHDAAARQLQALQASLSEAQQQESAQLAGHKEKLERKLKTAYDANMEIQHSNEATATRIKDLQSSNLALRAQGEHLTNTNEDLRQSLMSFRSNMSVADEFMDHTIEATGQALHKAPELQILKDLAGEDAENQQKAAQDARLKEVEGKSHISMLQHSTDPKSFEDMVSNLAAELKHVSDTKVTTKASLDAAFDKSMNQTAATHVDLVQKASSLQASLEMTTLVNKKLTAAVKHLEETQKTLLEKTDSLHRFAMRLSSATMPEGEKANANGSKRQAKQNGEAMHESKKGLISWLR